MHQEKGCQQPAKNPSPPYHIEKLIIYLWPGICHNSHEASHLKMGETAVRSLFKKEMIMTSNKFFTACLAVTLSLSYLTATEACETKISYDEDALPLSISKDTQNLVDSTESYQYSIDSCSKTAIHNASQHNPSDDDSAHTHSQLNRRLES